MAWYRIYVRTHLGDIERAIEIDRNDDVQVIAAVDARPWCAELWQLDHSIRSAGASIATGRLKAHPIEGNDSRLSTPDGL